MCTMDAIQCPDGAWVNERGAIMPEMAIRLEMAFKPSADHWLALQAAYDLWQARQHSADIHVDPVELDAA